MNGAFGQCLPDGWQVVGNWTASFASGVNPVRTGFKSAVTAHRAKGALFNRQQVRSLWLMHPLLGVIHFWDGWLVPLCANHGVNRTNATPHWIVTFSTPLSGVTGNSPQGIRRSVTSAFSALTNVLSSSDGLTVDADLIGSLVGVSVLFARHRTGVVYRTDAISPPSGSTEGSLRKVNLKRPRKD